MSRSSDTPDGLLFSRVYLTPTELLSDSERIRSRLAAYFHVTMDKLDKSGLARLIRSETGATVQWLRTTYDWTSHFLQCSLPDLLDTITLVYRFSDNQMPGRGTDWKRFVARAMREEGLSYRLDDKCGVRYLVDEEFERSRESVLRGLGLANMTAVRKGVEQSFEDLSGPEQNTRQAIRHMFEAVETLLKLLLDTTKDLDARLVQSELKAAIQRSYADSDASAAGFAATAVEALAKWVDAGHKYRHGPKADVPHAPPLELAILYLSQGASHIRWLIDALGTPRK